MMRTEKKQGLENINRDFEQRLMLGLFHCQDVGNLYSASIFLAFIGLLNKTQMLEPKRIGIFSYGSGCSSEFYSGIVLPGYEAKACGEALHMALEQRQLLSIQQYDQLMQISGRIPFGTRNYQTNISGWESLYDQAFTGTGLLTLSAINDYHRQYVWN